MKASDYGIRNLKRIMPKLIEWTAEEGKDFDDLEELYGQVYGQFNRYMGHVTANVGGVYEFYQTYDENKPIYTHVEKEKQKAAVMFLNQQLFKTPKWLINPEIIARTDDKAAIEDIGRIQNRTLNILMYTDRLNRMIENEAINGSEAYKIESMFSDVQTGIFDGENASPDVYGRNLQRAYVEKLISMGKSKNPNIKNSDISAVSRAALMKIKRTLESKSDYNGTSLNSMHFQDLVSRIERMDEK